MKSIPNAEWDKKQADFQNDRLIINGHQVMMNWETPYMHHMAAMLHRHTQGNILEVGFGMAISASELQRLGVESHTIIEPHPEVYQAALAWKKQYPESRIEIINDYWQNLRDSLPVFDGIFFDTYSPTIEEAHRKRFDFFRTASEKLLKKNGCLTFYYMRKELEPMYQEELFHNYSRIIIEPQKLKSPPDCEYADIDDYAACIMAIK